MANEFKKNVGGQVSKKDAQKWIEKFDKERKKDTKSVFFGKDVFDSIFADSTVTGVSFFFARKGDGNGKDADDLVLVGTREDGTLVWTDEPPSPGAEMKAADGGGSSTYDTGIQCPPYCPR
jgi:hypothetical protein